MINIKIRGYLPNDCERTAKLFFDTVHTINKADYSATAALRMGRRKYRSIRMEQFAFKSLFFSCTFK